MRYLIIFCLFFPSLASPAVLSRPLPTAHEPVWTKYIAQELGVPTRQTEFKVQNGYIDIYDVKRGIAWEVEWAGKHDEAVGQAIRYSINTGATGGIILLMGRGDRDKEAISYWICQAAAQKCGLRVMTFDVRKGH